jgi:heptosyltransferase-1
VKVLIVKASALGDVIHALPVLAWLRSADPAMEIDWLVEEGFAPLLEDHPLLRQVQRIATRRWRRAGRLAAAGETLRTLAALRRERYDVVLDLQGNSKSGLFTRFCGAPRRYGFAQDGVRDWPNLLATSHRVALAGANHHISERSLAIARAAFPTGQEHVLAGPLSVTPAADQRVKALLAEAGLLDRRFAVLHYGTTWPTKLWAVEQWQALVQHLGAATGLVPVLTWGSAEERAVVEAIARAADHAVVWPRGTLPELAALLARAIVVIGGDTGPVHLAAALDTPTVSLFRVTDAERNGPRGERHVRLQAPLECSPCLRKHCDRDGECSRSITAADGLAALRALGIATTAATGQRQP